MRSGEDDKPTKLVRPELHLIKEKYLLDKVLIRKKYGIPKNGFTTETDVQKWFQRKTLETRIKKVYTNYKRNTYSLAKVPNTRDYKLHLIKQEKNKFIIPNPSEYSLFKSRINKLRLDLDLKGTHWNSFIEDNILFDKTVPRKDFRSGKTEKSCTIELVEECIDGVTNWSANLNIKTNTTLKEIENAFRKITPFISKSDDRNTERDSGKTERHLDLYHRIINGSKTLPAHIKNADKYDHSNSDSSASKTYQRIKKKVTLKSRS